jgi:hypothetical protein
LLRTIPSIASNDPINGSDPTGLLTCAEVQVIYIDGVATECTDELLGVADSWLQEHHGISLDEAWAVVGYTRYNRNGRVERVCRGGFSETQCGFIAGALARMLGHTDAFCRVLGATARSYFAAGRFELIDGWIIRGGARNWGYAKNADVPGPWFDKLQISSEAFDRAVNIVNIIAHESYHFQVAPGGKPFIIDVGHRAFEFGDRCGGLPRPDLAGVGWH